MGLTLTIENHTSLPDGGPLSVSIKGRRGIDIGRDQYLDWTLPDPSRFISGRHCEVRWRDGDYWLHDISTNGTFLDGADSRLKEPHRLRNGERFAIGQYIIVATIDDQGDGAVAAAPSSPAPAPPSYEDLWKPVGDVAPPIDPKELKAPRDLQPVQPDFLDWAVDVPPPHTSSPSQRADRDGAPTVGDMSWAQGPPRLPPAPEAIPLPSPRRPVWVSSEPEGPWAAPPAAGTPAAVSATDSAAMADFICLFARGAGLPEDTFTARDPAQFAEQLGQLMRLVAENVRQLLEARQMARRFSRSSNQTTVQALDNNPLKFAPSAEDALRIMFGPPTRSYLDASRAFAQSFDDLKGHQLKTFSAMQHALRLMLGEFDPEVIENTAAADRGLAGMVGSRKARLWDIYVARWQARTQGRADGMLNAFMDYFADCYDRDEK
jgi:type VI secretion system protein ImpI